MSDQSDDDVPETFHTGPRTGMGAAAARNISALSDDESDGDARPTRSSAPPPESPMEDSPRSPPQYAASPAQSPREEPLARRRPPPRPLDSYQRTVTANKTDPTDIDVVFLPPSVPMPSAVTTTLEEDVPAEQCPILYRLRPDAAVDGEHDADVIMRRLRECDYDPLRLSEFLESNARLITWSDGSRSLKIGMHNFMVLDDNLASQYFIFRRGDKVQTHEASVSSVAHVQPSSSVDGHAKLVMAKAVERAANKRTASRTILRTMEDDAEKHERQARIDSQKRERERSRQDARKRQMKERQTRPNRSLSVEFVESNDEDSADERAHRIAERHDANRLMRAKHNPPPSSHSDGFSIKKRKLNARRVLQDEDDSDDD